MPSEASIVWPYMPEVMLPTMTPSRQIGSLW